MLKRYEPQDPFIPSWSATGHRIIAGLSRKDMFAIDLLHGELRLKRCEREENLDLSFDSDASIVSALVPSLLDTLDELDSESSDSEWVRLKARCFWLAAGFYLWRGQISHNVADSRDADKLGVEFIDATLKCLDLPSRLPIREVLIPHLGSPSRLGQHWKALSKQSLEAFRNEIQASSIVHLAQEQFFEAISKFQENGDVSLRPVDVDSLFTIGETLLRRYEPHSDAQGAKLVELVDDFIGVHGDILLSKISPKESSCQEKSATDWFDELIPSKAVDAEFVIGISSNPCILSILVTCLQTKGDRSQNILLLFARLVKTVSDICRSEITGAVANNLADRRALTEYSDCDDDSEDSDDNSRPSGGKAAQVKASQYMLFVQLLVEKARAVLKSNSSEDLLAFFMNSVECLSMLNESMSMISQWFGDRGPFISNDSDDKVDLRLFNSTRKLMDLVRETKSAGKATLQFDHLCISGLARIVTRQRHTLAGLIKLQAGRQKRQARQRLINHRAELLAEVCCHLGYILSSHSVVFEGGCVRSSDVFIDGSSNEISSMNVMTGLCENFLWLWQITSKDEGSTKDRLLIPVAVAVVGLCGSGISTSTKFGNANKINAKRHVRLTDFFDSDDSANEWLSDDEEHDSGEGEGHEELLRVIAQAVHCTAHVFGAIDDKDLISFKHAEAYTTQRGPLLPLVVARVLNVFADRLLVAFATEEDSLWEDYSFGTRTTGQALDSLLYKAYKALHGFTLTNASDGKESLNTNVSSSSSQCKHQPENVEAAAHLYRCIMRAYSRGRKSPPKASLDTVLDSLPPLKEFSLSSSIRTFLFNNENNYFDPSDVVALVKKNSQWESHLESLKNLFLQQQCQDVENQQLGTEDSQALKVRRGITHLLAQGAIPSHQESGNEGDERANASQHEGELSRKFSAIIDDLCLSKSSLLWLNLGKINI